MGYLLRGLRLASYLAAALGLLLFLGGIINNALFFYGIRLLFIGVVGIGATALLRDSFLEGTEEEEYNSLQPSSRIKTPKAIRLILYRWHAQSTEKQALMLVGIPASILCILILCIAGYLGNYVAP